MKKAIILSLVLLLSLPVSALANESNTEAEVTLESNQEDTVTNPDSLAYTLQRLYEQFLLITTFKDESKLDLYIELAEKRLAELQGLSDELKETFSEELYAEFLKNIEKAVILTVQLKEQDKQIDSILEEFESVIQEGEAYVNLLEEKEEAALEDEEQEEQEGQEEKEDKLDYMTVKPAVVAHLDSETITEMRDEGYGYGQIALITSIAELSDTPLDEVKELVQEHKGIGKVAKELGLHPGNLIMRGKAAMTENEKEADTDTNSEESTESELNEEVESDKNEEATEENKEAEEEDTDKTDAVKQDKQANNKQKGHAAQHATEKAKGLQKEHPVFDQHPSSIGKGFQKEHPVFDQHPGSIGKGIANRKDK